MKNKISWPVTLTAILALAIVIHSPKACAQNIAWGPATVITGDSDLATNGVYFDAFIPLSPISLSADGITFNAPTAVDSDGTISYVVTSGGDTRYDNNSLFTGGSAAFNAIMNAGGTFEFGDTGAGTVTISGLTPGHTYQVQIFDYAGDGDTGYTTFSGSTPVTLNTIGSGAQGGSFTTGTFTATNADETFNWTGGGGSSYTVLGAISVLDISVVVDVLPSLAVFQGDTVTLTAVVPAGQAYSYQWQTDNGGGGSTWADISGATTSNYVFDASSLAPGAYEYEVTISNNVLMTTSAPITLTVSAPTYPQLTQDTMPISTNEYVGGSVTFSASFMGNHPITNQWQFSTDGGATFQNISDATNSVLNLNDLQLTNAGEYRLAASNAFGFADSSPATLTVVSAPPDNINWGPAAVITGDSDLATNGIYFDAFIPLLPSQLSADGITFNAPAAMDSDGTISYVVTSGIDMRYDNNSQFTGGSSAFNAIMNAGGTYQNGDTGAGTVMISGLTLGHTYQVQIFDYAGDGDTGYTTFSGSTPVTLNTIGSGAQGGSFTTGTFTATAATELFNWNGCCGSSYTVLGAISVLDVTAVVNVSPAAVYQGETVTLSANTSLNPPLSYEWLTDNGGGGATWSIISGANNTNYIFQSGSLAVAAYEYEVVVSNSTLVFTSAPVTVTVNPPSAPSLVQDTTLSPATQFIGQSVTFTASFTGSPPITNQWQVSTDGGNTFNNIEGATNAALILDNIQAADAGEYRLAASNSLGFADSTPATLTVLAGNIVWGSATGITGDSDLVTNGIYFDALLPNLGAGAPLTADGIIFNSAVTTSSTSAGDGTISFVVTSGSINNYNSGSFPTAPPSSAAFAAIMDSGGTYETGGAGAGLVAISGLKAGHIYSVQVFNYATDGDRGLTTLSGTTPVSLSNLPESGGTNTYGEFATGTFIASSVPEGFNWNGAGSGYTVLGVISVVDVTGIVPTGSPKLTFGIANGLAELGWPSDHIGWRLEAQTNGLGTNWVTVPNSTTTNQVSISVSTNVANVFFRLIYP
jgi:hypothetical protein